MNGKNQVIRNARQTQKEQLQAQSETYIYFELNVESKPEFY